MPSVFLPLLFLLSVALPVSAAPEIPDALTPWVPWVLHPEDRRTCPVDQGGNEVAGENAGEARLCAWPGRLHLDLDGRGGSFSQGWMLYRDSWVPLPGDSDNWPLNVRDGEQPVPTVLHGGMPSAKLPAGRHILSGQLGWPRPPDGLTVPAETGLLSLSLDGVPVAEPRLERGGRLWLGSERDPAHQEEGDRLGLRVYRRIADDLPLRVTTRLELEVSGQARQVSLGPVLLKGGLPLRVQSPLPSRLDPDGELRLQVRPGSWMVELEEQHPGPVAELSRPNGARLGAEPWPEQEVWSFFARADLRQVQLAGPPAVDPRQAGVPTDWLGLPAYRLGPGETLALKEQRRGNPDPGPDRLALERDLWLDLAGTGFSIRDRIQGELTRSWRLEAARPLELGQVRVDGEPRLITRLKDGDPPGVEVRRGRLDLSADSRLAGPASGEGRSVPASGWDVPFDAIRTRVYLPPGWDLLAVLGADNLPDSWIARWSLLDLFLVLILALGIGRLWGAPWGLLALGALVLTWRVPDAPRLIWLHLLVAAALLRLLPEHPAETGMAHLRVAVRWYWRLSLVALVVMGLPFLVGQVRDGLYPHLERSWVGLGASAAGGGDSAWAKTQGTASRQVAPSAAPDSAPSDESKLTMAPDDLTEGILAPESAAVQSPAASAPPRIQDLDAPDPDARVQSGVGVPSWGWGTFELAWNGSVEPAEGARIWLLNPFWHLAWSLSGGVLAVLLGLRMAGLLGRSAVPPPEADRPADPSSELGSDEYSVSRISLSLGLTLGAGLILASLAWTGSGGARAGELPTPELLQDLRERLLEPPDCLPDCVDLGSLTLDAGPAGLRLTLVLDAAAPVAAPIPGGPGGWLPTELSIDGVTLDSLRRNARDQLLVPLSPGRHRLELAGPLPDRPQVEISFPLRPRQVQVRVAGWTLEGLDAAGHPGAQVRLVRAAGPGSDAPAPLTQGPLPPLIQVQRTLKLGLDWRVETRVRRLSPAEFPVVLAVPLIPGESVQTPGVQVQGNSLLVSLSPGETETGWLSTLVPASSLHLSAGSDPRIGESWSLDLSPRWHLEWSGIAPIHRLLATDRWLPTWRPLPGESLDLRISRPAAVPGPTLTLDRVDFSFVPGRRISDASLTLALRGTQGGTHRIRLPSGAEPTLLKVDGRELPLPGPGSEAGAESADTLEVPLVPGRQSVTVRWREPRGIAPRLRPATPDLGSPAVDLDLSIRMPEDRWVLFAQGPRIGPVVLFWGVLAVLAALALALGRVRHTPLRFWDWLLLGIGLSLAEVWVLVLVAGWLLALGLRRQLGAQIPRWRFNLIQVALGLLTLGALAALVGAVSQGLLGAPQMQILGNGSEGQWLRWYQDRGGPALPQVTVYSVPMWVYRGLMLAWALWLAHRLLGWLRWGWEGYSRPVLWREGEGWRGHWTRRPRAGA